MLHGDPGRAHPSTAIYVPEIKFYDTKYATDRNLETNSRTVLAGTGWEVPGDRRRGAERLPGGGGYCGRRDVLGGRKGRPPSPPGKVGRVEDLEPASSSAFRFGPTFRCRMGKHVRFPGPRAVVRIS
jgi:hypothetical protein